MSRSGLRFAAACAVASAITTFLLWLLPRLGDAYSLARLWVNFVHIFLALVAYGGVAFVLFRRAPARASLGFLWFVLWGFTELLGVTVQIFATRRAHIAGFREVWDALFFLLLVAFLLGSLCYGLAALRGGGRLSGAVGVLILLAVPLTAGIMLGGYTRFTAFDAAIALAYPVLQPVSRAVMGVWLWKETE